MNCQIVLDSVLGRAFDCLGNELSGLCFFFFNGPNGPLNQM